MRDVIAQVRRWHADDTSMALATVVQTWGSAPRRIGAKMAITADGRLAGSVSGGCVEGAVAEEAFVVLQTGRPQLLRYGVADETAWVVGLACGGTIRVFVEALDEEFFAAIDRMLAAEETGAVATVIAGPDELLGRKLVVDGRGVVAGHIHEEFDAEVLDILGDSIRLGVTRSVLLERPALELFVDVLLPPPTLIMVGGVHIAVALTSIAKTLGYRTIVIDPRHAFGSQERFPLVDRLLPQWPQDAFPQVTINENTAVALLTHDPKIDDPALEIVLNSSVFYVGALGSRKTHAGRVERLRDNGLSPQQIAKIHAPIGLDIDAQTPEEIALSIMAEIVAVRRLGSVGH